MKKMVGALAALVMAGGVFLGACSYAGIAASGDRVVVARNDNFLYGMLRAVYVCKITDDGLSDCKAGPQEG